MDSLELVKYRGSRQMLDALLKYPERRFTIRELAREAKVPFASAWRLVQRWEPAGLIETGRVGKSVTVKIHKSEYLDSVASLLKLSVSPQVFTARALVSMLANDSEVREAYLFGSVARGDETLASDVDVAIFARKGFDANRLVFGVYKRFGTKVVPLVFASKAELDAFMVGKKGERLK